jgi:hypothetical protein
MKTISDYMKDDFIKLINDIMESRGSEEYQDDLLEQFIELSEYPCASDLIYYPENPDNATPELIAEEIQNWRKANGKEGFKDS